MGKKRNLSVFDAIQELESEDVKTESTRRKRSTADHLRAQAAQSQTKIYNHLVQCRILFQRAMTSTENEENSDDVRGRCDALLQSLLEARSQLVSGASDVDGKYSELVEGEASDLDDVLDEEHDACRQRWKQVLNKRHADLKLHSGLSAKSQFRVMDSSFWQQVEGTVEYEKMRTDSKEDSGDFDDSKVYQQLLKEFVATSANSDANARPARSTKKSKKQEVDRRASKGRKVRYKEIPKLVNFTFPLSRANPSNLDQDEWFQSLFGGVGARTV
jgi:protein AATF/BFR2